MMAWWMTCVVMQINTHMYICTYMFRYCCWCIRRRGVRNRQDPWSQGLGGYSFTIYLFILFALSREAHKLKNINNKKICVCVYVEFHW
jgi:hypothetical protein